MFELVPTVSLGIGDIVSRHARDLARPQGSSLTCWESEQGKALKQKVEGGQAKQLGIRVLATGVILHQSALYDLAVDRSGGDPLLARMNLRTVGVASDLLNQDLLSYLFVK